MEKYLITGGKKLYGEVNIESAKNSVLPLLVASILTDQKVIIKNCPKILDVLSMLEILAFLGVEYKFVDQDVIIDSSNMSGYEIPKNLCEKLRASVFTLGALVSRFKHALISYPGGCDIGERAIDIHLDCMRALGVNVLEKDDRILCDISNHNGGKYTLKYPSVGATENAILLSVLANGKTEIRNCAKEPEIVDLANMLNKMGAKIFGVGTSSILIDGVKKLHGIEYKPLPDRIEAGTFMLATAITGGELQLNNCNLKNIYALSHKLCDNTCKIYQNNDIIYIKSGTAKKCFSVSTGPYPDFPTDLQAPISALACVSDGKSLITENVFENRFGHFNELKKMGARVEINGKTATIYGVKRLTGASVNALDLRCGASLVLAGLNAEGVSVVNGAHHVKRGYYNFDKKLRSLGADVIIQEDKDES